jgi:hypothetical protein
VEYLRVGIKGTNPRKAKWIETGRVRELYPHLQLIEISFWRSKSFQWGGVIQGIKKMLKNQSAQNLSKMD